MIRFVVEMPGNDPDTARRSLLETLVKGSLTPTEGYWHVRIKEFERVREAMNRYENDPTTLSQLQIVIRDAFANIAGFAP
jgi:hypothetical protein